MRSSEDDHGTDRHRLLLVFHVKKNRNDGSSPHNSNGFVDSISIRSLCASLLASSWASRFIRKPCSPDDEDQSVLLLEICFRPGGKSS